jgi:integrase
VVEGGADAAGYVWPGRDGGPMDEGTPGQALERALARAGLGTWSLNDRGQRVFRGAVGFHGLRHSAASIMLHRNVPPPIVSAQLGHANPNITATIYAHLLADAHLDQAAAAFNTAGGADTVGEKVGETDD